MKENKNNNLKKKNFILLLSNTIISWMIVLLLITFVFIYFFKKPFPERLFVQQMTQEMISAGQNVTLILLESFGFTAIGLMILNFIFCLYISWFTFGKGNYYFKQKIIYEKKKVVIDFILKFFIVVFYLLLPFLFVIYLWLIYNKQYNSKFKNSKWILSFWGFIYIPKYEKASLIMSMLFLPIVVPVAAVSYMYSPFYSKYPLKKNINEYLTFSNTQPNTFILYFDTTPAIYWNIMMKYDEVVNGENSFIKMFPEFTSFFNVLTTACPTVYSNPAIYSGHLYDPYFKNFGVQTKSLINDQPVNTQNMTYDDFYLESFSNLFNMCINENFTNIKLNNAPYYGKDFTPSAGELYKLEEDLKNKKQINITAMDTVTLVDQLMGRNVYNFSHNGTTESYCLENINKYFKFTNTDSGVFNYYFNQSHHWPSSYRNSDGKLVADISIYSHRYFDSLYTSIQSLKNILNTFKNEPFLDENNEMIENPNGSLTINGKNYISVYDKTMFIIESDHGYHIDIKKNKYIRGILDTIGASEEQKNIILNYSQEQYNSVIQIKNFKFDKNNNLLQTISEQTPEDDNWYNDKRMLVLSDIAFITETLMNSYNNTTKDSSMFYSVDSIDQKYSDYFNSIVYNNPLSANLNDINNREIYVSWANDWQYFYNEKRFKFIFFDRFYNNQEFFKDSNFVKTDLNKSLFTNK